MSRRFLSTFRSLQSHENPLGLPKTGTPPHLAARMQRGLPQKRPIAGVKRVIAVSSAKGGVGKSTIAANLSLSLARLGLRTGILDTDIFGPSIPTLFNLTSYSSTTTPPRTTSSGLLIPLTNYGVATMSMGYLLPSEGSPVVWRGMMVMKALQQLLHSVAWDNLDVLVLDMPPGTGDTQLTISQQVEVDGAVVVSTPQDLALKDAMKGLEMFRKVDVRVLGMVQNMSVFCCPNCGHETHVFGEDGVRRRCEEMEVQLLGNVPLDARICEDADRGKPTVVAEPGEKRAEVYEEIARKVAGLVGLEVR